MSAGATAGRRASTYLLVLVFSWLIPTRVVLAQEPAPPASAPPPPSVVSSPATPPLPSPSPPASGEPSRETLEDRLRKMETTNQQLLEKLNRLTEKYDALSQRVEPAPAAPEVSDDSLLMESDSDFISGPEGTIGRGTGDLGGVRFGGGSGAAAPAESGETERTAREGVGSQSTRGPQGTISRTRESEEEHPAKISFGRGLEIKSNDGEFQLVFHDLTQAEYRFFPNVGDQSPLKNQFYIPRQRWYFIGRITKDVDFYTVINRGYGALDMLDAFLDFNYLGPKFRLRVGRTKTPTSYEYYQIAEGDLISPERSLYTGNLSGNRQMGMMLHGRIFDESAEYAIGLFNGPRRSFQDFNNSKDPYFFYNMRPFQSAKSEWLEPLKVMNIGGSFDFGDELNPPQPPIFTTANDQTGTPRGVLSLSPTFLQFNSNVVENGLREHWSAWIAWYYKSFNLLAQYDGGFQDYSIGDHGSRVRVPSQGFFIQPYYFLTGEQIKRRVDVTPLRDFSIKNGRITGPGALEVHARFSYLNMGHNMFTSGLADPNLWTNQASTIDVGMNWYPNRYTKIYLDWQHNIWGDEVFNGINSYRKSVDLLWIRWQLFF